jgi:hypothetical protein
MTFTLSVLDDHIDLRGFLGEGGMGEVHRAWDRRLERAVAVKFLRRAAPQEEERLLIEARLQARVDHPRVVRVHEVGTLGGRPCLVLQLVEGRNLGQLAGQLSVEAKVELVRQAALGLHAAHLQGLVHRDVKPSNVLVEDGPAGALSALVTDFGVARDEEGGLTRTGLLPGTLDFMSPEQLAGEGPVDFRADVYSLGATLYAVLAGRPPFRTTLSGPDEAAALVRRILEDPPPALPALAPGVRRDLAAVVAKAMEKETEARYTSAEAFAEDLARYQRGERILARASSLPERALQWARRNRRRARVAVAAALALFVSLAGGLAATYWQWRRAETARRSAEQSFEEVRRLAGSLLFDVHDAIEKLPGSTRARELIVARAVEYLDRLSTSSVGARVQAELAAAYLKLSRVQGVDGLGDARAAIASCRKAAALAEELASRPGATFDQRELLATAQRLLSVALANAGEGAEANALILESMALLQTLIAEQPHNPAPRAQLAAALWARGNRCVDAADWAGAFEAHLQSARLYESLAREEPAKQSHRANQGLEYRNLAGVALKLGRSQESRSFAERAVALDRERILEGGDASAKSDLAVSLGSVAEADEAEGLLEDALARQREALALHQALVLVDPANAFLEMQVAYGRGRLAGIHARKGDAAAALTEQRSSTAAWRALVERHQDVLDWELSLARAEAALGDRLAASPLAAGAPSSASPPEEACGAWLRAQRGFAAVRERLAGENLAFGEELASRIARCPGGARAVAEGGRGPPAAK